MIESNVILVITVVFMVIFQNPTVSAAEIEGSEDQFQATFSSREVSYKLLCVYTYTEEKKTFFYITMAIL